MRKPGECLAAFTLSMALGGAVLASSFPVQAGPDVTVVNPSSQPVPVTGSVGIVGAPTVNVGNPETSPVLVRDVDRLTGTPVSASALCLTSATSAAILLPLSASQTFALTDYVIAGNTAFPVSVQITSPSGFSLGVIVAVDQTTAHTFGTPILFHGSWGNVRVQCGGPAGDSAEVTISGILQ